MKKGRIYFRLIFIYFLNKLGIKLRPIMEHPKFRANNIGNDQWNTG